MSASVFVPLGITSKTSTFDGFTRINDMSEKVLGIARDMLLSDGDPRNCGVLTVLSEKAAPLALRQAFVWNDGAQSLVKDLPKYALISLEKAERLWWNAEYGDLTSYESRDPDAMLEGQSGSEPWGKWGGAILLSVPYKLVLSFSGFPERWDEAAMYALAVKLGWMSQNDERFRLVSRSNRRVERLLVACRWIE